MLVGHGRARPGFFGDSRAPGVSRISLGEREPSARRWVTAPSGCQRVSSERSLMRPSMPSVLGSRPALSAALCTIAVDRVSAGPGWSIGNQPSAILPARRSATSARAPIQIGIGADHMVKHCDVRVTELRGGRGERAYRPRVTPELGLGKHDADAHQLSPTAAALVGGGGWVGRRRRTWLRGRRWRRIRASLG
jgi:hypothetical protein